LVLAFAGGAASMPLITSHRGPLPTDAIGAPAPAAALPVPDFGSRSGNGDPTGAGPPAPAAEPVTPVDTPGAIAVLEPQTIRSTKRTTSRSKSRASTARSAQQRTSAIPPEADALIKRWSQRD
jgi:hypothetical protein